MRSMFGGGAIGCIVTLFVLLSIGEVSPVRASIIVLVLGTIAGAITLVAISRYIEVRRWRKFINSFLYYRSQKFVDECLEDLSKEIENHSRLLIKLQQNGISGTNQGPADPKDLKETTARFNILKENRERAFRATQVRFYEEYDLVASLEKWLSGLELYGRSWKVYADRANGKRQA